MTSPWQYDETTQIGTDYRDRQEVSVYDQKMRKLRDVNAENDDIKKALSLSSRSIVWEIGTGTGECALALAATVEHVFATDVSPTMLEYAHHKAEQRCVNNVTFAKGGFLSGFQPHTPVDGVVTQLALHHLPDFWKSRALVCIAHHLRPHGRLYLRDVVFPAATGNFDEFFERAIDDVRAHAGDEAARQTTHHIKSEYSTLDWILEGMIARSGLKIIEKSDRGFLSTYICER